MPYQLSLTCDHVVHSASKCQELINILTNGSYVISPKAEHICPILC